MLKPQNPKVIILNEDQVNQDVIKAQQLESSGLLEDKKNYVNAILKEAKIYGSVWWASESLY